MHVILNGVNSRTIQGLEITSLPPVSAPPKRTNQILIDGRDGDILEDLGYSAYEKAFTILLHNNYDPNEVIGFFSQSGTVIFSNEPDMVYTYEMVNGIDISKGNFNSVKVATITFHVQPYKLSATEEPATGEVSTLVDRTPYIIRRTPFGTRQKGTIIGGSLVWNQLSQTTRASFTAHGLTYVGEDGKTTVTGTFTGGAGSAARYGNSNKAIPAGHKVALLGGKSDTWFLRLQGMTYTPTKGNDIIEATDGALADIVVRPNLATNTEVNETFYFKIIDLTLMLGPTIADYIYTQEQATAGAGVALAKAWAGITADYYPYDPGSIKSVEGLTAHRMTGKNRLPRNKTNEARTYAGVTVSAQDGVYTISGTATASTFLAFDLEEPVDMSPSTTKICFLNTESDGNLSVAFYRDNTRVHYWQMSPRNRVASGWTDSGNEVANKIAFVVTTGKTYNMTVSPMFVYLDVPNADTFEPYTAHTYPLDSSLTLRGLLKHDGDNLYYDGDIYPSSGEVTRKYRQMTITGNESWSVVGDRFSITITPQGTTKASEVIVAATAFIPDTADNLYVNRTSDGYIGIAVNAGRIFIVDNANFSTKDVSAFKTYLQGLNSAGHPLTIIYELATPTTEQAEPYTELQICDPAGTEEWVGASMPVGHETAYIDPISMTVTNEGNTTSAPSITIEGEGSVEVTVDGLNILQIQMPSSGEITIDSKTLDATDGEGGLANRSVTGDYNGLRLAPGEHTVTVTGDVTSVTLKNTSRWI